MKISGADTSPDNADAIQPPVACMAVPGYEVGESNLELCAQISNSDSDVHSDFDESELGEFLLDTFDAMEAQGSPLVQMEMPV